MKLFEKPKPFLIRKTSKRNSLLIVRLILVFVFLVTLNMTFFKLFMLWEGQEHSWITSLYWTATNMSTLGLGDIVFYSDTGRLFTVFVNFSGLLFILVLVPFTLYQLFQSTARIPKEVPGQTRQHVILTNYNDVTRALIKKFNQYRLPYIVVIQDITEASNLTDLGIKVVAREIEDPETYKHLQINKSLGIVLTGNNFINTSIAYAIRQISKEVNIISTATTQSGEDVLISASVNNVLKLDEMMGKSLARRITSSDALAHIIGEFGNLRIAEATVTRTPIVNKLIKDADLRKLIGVSIVGTWENGSFKIATPNTRITNNTILVLAGSQEQIDGYNELFCIYNISKGPTIIIGGGNVGQALSSSLNERDVEHVIIEKNPTLALTGNCILGDACDVRTLMKADLMNAHAVAITTHDDKTNVFLTTLIRKLRPDIQIISRATLERTVQILQDAGCDFVMSYASMGANSIFNILQKENILMVAEGVDLFKVEVPSKLYNKAIKDSHVRPKSGCSIIAYIEAEEIKINPDPKTILTKDNSIILIGTFEAEKKFFEVFVS
jgi:Trk K+ transport system NAD-binding subunit